MSRIEIFDDMLLTCPECKINKRTKTKFFSDIKDLNIHLKQKHQADYKISINGKLRGSAIPILRPIDR